MTFDKHHIRIACTTACLIVVGVLPPGAKAADYDRALALSNQWIAECGLPKDREFESYSEAILDHRPATPVSPMSTYCERLYENVRTLNPYLPVAPPETYEQAFAKVVYLQDKFIKECSVFSDTVAKLIDGRAPKDSNSEAKYCDLLYQNLEDAKRNFDIAERESDEMFHALVEHNGQR